MLCWRYANDKHTLDLEKQYTRKKNSAALNLNLFGFIPSFYNKKKSVDMYL